MKEFLLICFFLFSVSFYNIEVKAGDLRIIDGDTIILHGEKIRFSGIDAPELKQTCNKYNQPVYCGILAKEVLLKRVGNKIPTCIKEGKDFYNRFLAECFINESSLSQYLVRSGYAFAYRKYSTKFIKDEEYAKQRNLGIWSMKFKYPWEFRK